MSNGAFGAWFECGQSALIVSVPRITHLTILVVFYISKLVLFGLYKLRIEIVAVAPRAILWQQRLIRPYRNLRAKYSFGNWNQNIVLPLCRKKMLTKLDYQQLTLSGVTIRAHEYFVRRFLQMCGWHSTSTRICNFSVCLQQTTAINAPPTIVAMTVGWGWKQMAATSILYSFITLEISQYFANGLWVWQLSIYPWQALHVKQQWRTAQPRLYRKITIINRFSPKSNWN